MKYKRVIIIVLLSFSLACNFLARTLYPPTPTPLPTNTITPSPTATQIAPAYIPPSCQSQPVATVSAATAQAQETQVATPEKPISRDEQLDIFERMTHIVDEVYVYPDFNGTDWEEIKSRYRIRIESGLDAQEFYSGMQAMISELGDEHSVYLSPIQVQETEEELNGEFKYVGIGVDTVPIPQRHRVSIIFNFPDSPAEHSGLKPHDSILLVDGKPLNEDATGLRLLGPKCSAVILTVQSPGETPREMMLIRESITGAPQADSQLIPTGDGSKIGYIFIPTFFDETIPAQVENALDQFGPLDGLILDVRYNTGGSSDVAEPILSRFVSGTLGAFNSRDESRPMKIKPDPIQNSQTVPLVVLVNDGTVSYGEIFSGVLKDSGRAKIVGQRSLGNVEVLRGYHFQDGSQLWIAQERFVPAHSRDNWEETGIVPDLEAYADWDTFTFETDPSIAAAVKLLGH